MDADKDDCSNPSSSNGQDIIQVSISSMTGQKWIENISHNETVQGLKNKIWRRCGLLPYHQGLIFDDRSLPDDNDRILLKDFGIHQDSLIRLVLVTRSGPVAVQHPSESTRRVEIEVTDDRRCSTECWDGRREFSDDFLEENRRTMFKMCELRRQMRAHASGKPVVETFDSLVVSAPEDTSAKESSAGDTECDDEKFSSSETAEKVSLMFLPPCGKTGTKRERHSFAKDEVCEEDACTVRDNSLSARDRLLVMMNSRAESPSTDINAPSEDGSEFSSGMIICDLTNEFRRLRVRRKHHVGNNTSTTQKTHIKSKSKPPSFVIANHHKGSDLTSSDDELPFLRRSLDSTCANARRADAGSSCPAFRRPPNSSRGQKVSGGYQSQHRCYTCASKFNNYSIAFHCRCGKRLCSRHRPAKMHTCARLRKMQDVSD